MKTVIVDNRIGDTERRALMLYGYYPIELPTFRRLGTAVASHPDTLLFKYNNEIITSADYCDDAAYIFTELRERHPELRITFTADMLTPEYPGDCKFNALVIGKRLFCKTDTVSRAILELAEREGLRLCHTAQGYPACSTLVLSDNAAITADRGMAKAMTAEGIRVTLISQGCISLPPHEYGFIGGASAISDGRVYFFGDLSRHPDCRTIESALRDEGLIPTSLSSIGLTDLGGAIFLEDQTDHHGYHGNQN